MAEHGNWAGKALENLASLADGEPRQVRLVTGTPGPAVTLGSMIERDIAGDGAVFYLLVCRECGNGDLVMPFTSQAERGKWAGAHTRGTGHDRWFVTETNFPLTRQEEAEMLARHDGALRPDPGTEELRLLAADLLELHEAGALAGIRAVVSERLRQVRGEPAEGIDGRAFQAAMLAEEIDREGTT